jgi:hypothetical protein
LGEGGGDSLGRHPPFQEELHQRAGKRGGSGVRGSSCLHRRLCRGASSQVIILRIGAGRHDRLRGDGEANEWGVVEQVVWDLIREVIEFQLLVGGVGTAVGVFTEKGVDPYMYCGCFSFLLWVSDFPLSDRIMDRADLKWAISPTEL